MSDQLPAPPPRTFKHVAVLMGGWSAERDISLKSGAAIATALAGEGYQVTSIDVDRDIAGRLRQLAPDVCFNALHGPIGEDGAVQGVLECLGIPYTHSGVGPSALCMHKEHAKTVMQAHGVPVADALLCRRGDAAAKHMMALPYVVKPIADGSSFGVVIVAGNGDGVAAKISAGGSPDDIIMVERFIPGRELTCAVIGTFVTEVTEILPADHLSFYDFEAKYALGGSQHVLPANILPDIYQKIREYTLKAHQALGCRGVTRADFRFDDQSGSGGEVICLEVNTQPGMTETSLVPEFAARAGWSFGELVRWIVEDASCDRSTEVRP